MTFTWIIKDNEFFPTIITTYPTVWVCIQCLSVLPHGLWCGGWEGWGRKHKLEHFYRSKQLVNHLLWERNLNIYVRGYTFIPFFLHLNLSSKIFIIRIATEHMNNIQNMNASISNCFLQLVFLMAKSLL